MARFLPCFPFRCCIRARTAHCADDLRTGALVFVRFPVARGVFVVVLRLVVLGAFVIVPSFLPWWAVVWRACSWRPGGR